MDNLEGPLSGITVVESSSLIAGPMTASLLGDYGARVIKIESPNEAESTRQSSIFRFFSHNKESVTCKLSTPEGAALYKRLIREVDVAIEGFRPGTFERWGLGREELRKENPNLVLVHISGFGRDGPYSDQPGYGRIAEAMAGFHYVTGMPDGPPISPGIPVADVMTGFAGFSAICLALYGLSQDQREGAEIDLSLYGPMLYQFGPGLLEGARFGESPERRGHDLAARPSSFHGRSLSAVQQASDGKWLIFSGVASRFDRIVADFLGIADIDRGNLSDRLAQWISRQTRENALAQLRDIGLPCAPINSALEVLADEHFNARGEFRSVVGDDGVVDRITNSPFRINGRGGQLRSGAPALGVHNRSIYGELLGIKEDELEKLRAAGII